MSPSRRLTTEGIGALLLAATVIGSGVMAERLAGGNTAIALLANTRATVAVVATPTERARARGMPSATYLSSLARSHLRAAALP